MPFHPLEFQTYVRRHIFFLALSYLCLFFRFKKRYSVAQYLVYLFIPSIVATNAVLIFNPEIKFYRGLSALDWALYGILMVQLFYRKHWVWKTGAVFMFILFIIKIIYQIKLKHSLFVPDLGTGIVNMPNAHIAGAISGIACAWIHRLIIDQKQPTFDAD